MNLTLFGLIIMILGFSTWAVTRLIQAYLEKKAARGRGETA